MNIKPILRKFSPNWLLRLYHRVFSVSAKYLYRLPGRKLVIIGVTGTNGKSTVVQMIGHILEETGNTVAWMSTATERIAKKERLNPRKMTMPGHGELQRFMRTAVDAGCTHAVLEVSSQGVEQGRHVGIPFDVGVFTNLTPEHIESHGSFDAYKNAKLRFFRGIASERVKKRGKLQERSIVINLDSKYAIEFFSVHVEKYFGTTSHHISLPEFTHIFSADNIRDDHSGNLVFHIDGTDASLPAYGMFMIDNALSAIAAAHAVGVPTDAAAAALATFPGVPGRQEFIQREPFTILVDYAPEPASMEALYSFIQKIPHKRLIHVFGSAGGGRDVARRPILGKYVGERAHVAIVTNEDPYDENPLKIIDQVSDGVKEVIHAGSQVTLFQIKDRRLAIRKAVEIAEPGDLVVATGKGCEQWIMGPLGSKKPWDERRIIREEIARKAQLST